MSEADQTQALISIMSMVGCLLLYCTYYVLCEIRDALKEREP